MLSTKKELDLPLKILKGNLIIFLKFSETKTAN